MNEFSNTVSESLGHYVYELIDPRDNKIFYVGEGVGNRVFSHETEASENPEVSKAKLEKIRQIQDAGYEVKKIIVHSGMDDKTAFECECTLIDGLYSAGIELTNIVAGHHSNIMSVNEAESVYGAEKIYSDDYPEYKFLVIIVKYPILDDDPTWRLGWLLNDASLQKVDYICFRFGKVIRKVFKLHHDATDWFIYGLNDITNKDGTPKLKRDFIGTDEVPEHFLNNKIIYENQQHEIKATGRGGEQWSRKYFNTNIQNNGEDE